MFTVNYEIDVNKLLHNFLKGTDNTWLDTLKLACGGLG